MKAKAAFLSLLLLVVGVALALVLGGCGDTFNTPVKREYTQPTVVVNWVEVATEAELFARCQHAGEDKKILACAFMGPVCTIYTHKNPTLDILGHEMLHCFTGRWHS